MRQITVIYHQESGTWWAESPNLPGFSSAADSLTELRRLTREGVSFALEGEPHMILEVSMAKPTLPVQQRVGSAGVESLMPSMPNFARNLVRPARSEQSTNPSLVLA